MQQYSPEFFANNKQRYAHYAADYRDKLKAEMVEAYGGKCVACGITSPVVLCLDHINDDAWIEKEEFGLNARGGHKHYARLKQQGWPKDRHQLMCYNCNAEKEHKRRREVMFADNGEKQISTAETRSRSHANVGAPKNNKSGFKGVFWDNTRGAWTAKIMVNYKQVHLGMFDDIRDAVRAHRTKSIEVWGDYAKVVSDEEMEQILLEQSQPIVTELTAEELGL